MDPVPLFGRPAAVAERSIFRGHTYFVFYLIAPLVKIFPVRIVLMSLDVVSFTALGLLAYVLLRRKGVSIAAACLFCLLIVAQPAWWKGLLLGQFYPDRFFILAGFVFMSLVSLAPVPQMSKTWNRVWLLIAALACASINERGALVAGMFLLLYVILYWKKPGLDRYYELALSAGLLFYGFVALKFLIPNNTDYSSFLPRNLSDLLYTVQLPRFLPLLTLFLLVNAPLFFLALFEWWGAIIAAILMGPNIIGDIGGGEKTGWVTHYPSFFFPSLVWAGLVGYSALFEKTTTKKRLPALYAITSGLILLLWMLNPDSTAPISISFSNVTKSVLPTFTEEASLFLFQTGPRRNIEDAADGIRRAVPRNSVVSTIEAGMPLLYQDRTIEFFPKDIDHADYAVLGAQEIDGKITYNGAISFLGADELKKFNELVLARMKRDGYDLDHPQLFTAINGLAVVRRIH
jgi:hypothetical protein